MGNVQFEEENNYNINNNMNIVNKNDGGFVPYLVRKGIFKNEKSASTALLIVSILFLLLSILLLIKELSPERNIKYNISKDVLERLPIQIQEKIKNSNAK